MSACSTRAAFSESVATQTSRFVEAAGGKIVVLDTPYFQKTDPDGHYRLTDLPAGQWVLKAWLEDDTIRAQPVELRVGATLHVDFPAP